jgi:hypothetical protein
LPFVIRTCTTGKLAENAVEGGRGKGVVMKKLAKPEEAKRVYKDALKIIRRLIVEARKREQNQRSMLRWNIKHSQYVEASRSLAWAQQQEAFREGLETALVSLGEKK